MRFLVIQVLLSLETLGFTDLNGCKVVNSTPPYEFDVCLTCEGNLADLEELQATLKNASNSVTALLFQNAILDTLPSDMFKMSKQLSLRKIQLHNVTLGLLWVPELGSPPFKSVEDTVESLEIYKCSNVFAWDLKSLKFKNLKTFIMDQSDVYALRETFDEWCHLSFFQLVYSSIQWIHPSLLQKNSKLTVCSLSHNMISSISRSLFPKPAPFLYSIDLSYNKLTWIPDDMFVKMDVLHELKLDNNYIAEISEVLLNPVWLRLTYLWIDGNIVKCMNLCWMIKTPNRKKFLESSTCIKEGNILLVQNIDKQCKES